MKSFDIFKINLDRTLDMTQTESDAVWAVITRVNICIADLNGDGELDFVDISDFLAGFMSEDPAVDFNSDGEFDFVDISGFLDSFTSGCP